jgi:excisionase family DNA binding protein
MVGKTGFEPATPWSRTKWSPRPTVTNDSQTIGTVEVSAEPAVHPSQPFTGSAKDFVTRLLPATPGLAATTVPLLTVREVAERLGVSRAKVYKLCEKGTLPHIQLANVIRFDPAVLDAFLAGAPRPPRGV